MSTSLPCHRMSSTSIVPKSRQSADLSAQFASAISRRCPMISASASLHAPAILHLRHEIQELSLFGTGDAFVIASTKGIRAMFRQITSNHSDPAVEDFAAELTEATYPVMLRQGIVENWLELELELWRTLTETVKKWESEWPRAGVMLVCPKSI